MVEVLILGSQKLHSMCSFVRGNENFDVERGSHLFDTYSNAVDTNRVPYNKLRIVSHSK